PAIPATPVSRVSGRQGFRALANDVKHYRFSNLLLVDGFLLGFGNEFLKIWIITDWNPHRVDLQACNGNNLTGGSCDQLAKYFYRFLGTAGARFNFGQCGK